MLFSLLVLAASKTSEDKRLGIELSMIKQRLSRNETRFQWVEGATMPAHVLTKGKNTLMSLACSLSSSCVFNTSVRNASQVPVFPFLLTLCWWFGLS